MPYPHQQVYVREYVKVFDVFTTDEQEHYGVHVEFDGPYVVIRKGQRR